MGTVHYRRASMGLFRGQAGCGKPAEGLGRLREPVKLTLELGQCDGRTGLGCRMYAQGLDAQATLPCDGFFNPGCIGIVSYQPSRLVQRASLELGVDFGEDETV
jgi:hypothetical protein